MRLQDVLRAYGIESKLEQRFEIRGEYSCEKHGPIIREGLAREIDGVSFILCPKCSRISPITTYSADQWIQKLGLIIGQDGKARRRKQLSMDEEEQWEKFVAKL